MAGCEGRYLGLLVFHQRALKADGGGRIEVGRPPGDRSPVATPARDRGRCASARGPSNHRAARGCTFVRDDHAIQAETQRRSPSPRRTLSHARKHLGWCCEATRVPGAGGSGSAHQVVERNVVGPHSRRDQRSVNVISAVLALDADVTPDDKTATVRNDTIVRPRTRTNVRTLPDLVQREKLWRGPPRQARRVAHEVFHVSRYDDLRRLNRSRGSEDHVVELIHATGG